MNEKEQIIHALKKDFETERIVFWYDWNKEENKPDFKDFFNDLNLDGVEKIELNNNEFSVKYRILRQEPDKKFLIYQSSQRPKNEDNWLLDVLLANKEFHANQNALWLAEIGLDYNVFHTLPEQHKKFFRKGEFRNSLRETVSPQDNYDIVRLKMLASIIKTEDKQYDIEHIVLKLLNLYADDELDEVENKIKGCNLYDFLFKQIENKYVYHTNNPSITDFIIQLFLYNFQSSVGIDIQYRLNNEARNLFSNWKNNRQYVKYFKTVSEKIYHELNIEEQILDLPLDTLAKIDCFKSIEERIFVILSERINNNSDLAQIPECIAKRVNSVWWDDKAIQDMYSLLKYAAQFLSIFNSYRTFNSETPKEAVNNYVQKFYLIDLYYRNYFAILKDNQNTELEQITKKLETCYDTYLLSLNECWQHFVDREPNWEFDNIPLQKDFFKKYLKNISGNNKIVVIISDAMRYEIGKELSDEINKVDKYISKIGYMLSSVPSYTQLGMAALLPHTEITVKEDGNCYIDGNASAGIENRAKLLSKCGLNTAAINANDFRNFNRDQARDFLKGKNIVYIYDDKIDQNAHNASAEKFTHTQEYIETIITLIKKLCSANVYNFIITADHGFIYNNFELSLRHYIDEKPLGNITIEHRRFIAGHNINSSNNFKQYCANNLSLSGDMQFAFPKSINRLRKRGSDDKYVHGGLSLQEVVIPIIEVNHKREDTIDYIDVEVINDNKIITNQIKTVKFYQSKPVETSILPRTLYIAFYNSNNKLISNQETITFNSSSNDVTDREKTVTFRFGDKLSNENNKSIYLYLKESEYKEYKKYEYKIRITFQPDF